MRTCSVLIQTQQTGTADQEELVKTELLEKDEEDEMIVREEQGMVEEGKKEEEEETGRGEKVSSKAELAQEEIKRMLARVERNKRGPTVLACEICQMKYKKIYKLKLHIMKHHLKEISERFKTEKEPGT